MNSLNLNTSTPIKRIRFRGDSFQETEPLLDNDYCDESHITKSGEMPKEKGDCLQYFFKLHIRDTSIKMF